MIVSFTEWNHYQIQKNQNASSMYIGISYYLLNFTMRKLATEAKQVPHHKTISLFVEKNYVYFLEPHKFLSVKCNVSFHNST